MGISRSVVRISVSTCHVLPNQDNFQYGDAAQLVGGYAAGALVISAASALAYFGLWLRCVLQIRQPQGGDPEAATAGGAQVPQKSKRHLYRPLGPYLWPIALTNS